MSNNQHRTTKRGGLAVFIIFLIFGITFTAIGAFGKSHYKELKEQCTKKVDAEVVDLQEYKDSDGDRQWRVIIGYEYKDRYYEEDSGFSSSNAKHKYPIGTELNVKIDPKHPEVLYCKELDGTAETLMNTFHIVGIAFIVIAGLMLVKAIIKLIIIGGAFGIAASQTKKFDQQQAQFYGQNQWNQMNSGQTIYTDDINNQMNQMNPNYQQPQQGQMYNQQQMPQQGQQQGQGLNGLGNIKF